jgi:uncharacterized protein YegL
MAVIVFAGKAKTIVQLNDITTFYTPKLPIGGGTSLNNGFRHLINELKINTVKNSFQQKGDWKPIVFLFTDGSPTDNNHDAIDEWIAKWKNHAFLVAIAFGNIENNNLLQQLTREVYHFNNKDKISYQKFFKWVTDSIKTNSIGVENQKNNISLSKIESDIFYKIDTKQQNSSKGIIDNNYVVISAKCQNTKRPYLIKYKKQLNNSEIPELNLQTLAYNFDGSFQVDNSYFELLDNSIQESKINTENLFGNPTCPSCGNPTGFAMCTCGKVHCIGKEQLSTCPWCNSQGSYGFGNHFDVNRGQG